MEKDSAPEEKSQKKFKPIYLIAGLILIALILGFFILNKGHISPSSGSGNGTTVTMLMHADVFEPVDLTIKQGTKVVFKNVDTDGHWPASDIHPTHGIYPEFDPKQPVNPGDSWSFVFDKVGRWRYHDHLVPSTRGVITVTP